MCKLLYIFVLAGFLFQVNDAVPSAIIIAQYTPKFAGLAIKIANTVKDGSRAIENGQNQIQTTVDYAENTINKELKDVNDMVEKEKTEAAKEHKDISSCVKEEETEIQKIDPNTLNECRNVSDIQNLNMMVTQMATEEVTLTLAVNLCIIKNPILGSKLKACFDEKINDVESKITQFKTIVTETIQYAQEESFNCVNTDIKTLDERIEDVTTEFKVCTDKIME